MITLEELRIGYRKGRKELPLTVPLSFTATGGEMTGIVGPNGVGKSTLLRTLARQQEPLGGRALLHEKPLGGYGRDDFARMCSFVPAGHLPVSRLTVYDTVAMARYPYTGWQGRLTPADEQAVRRALEEVHLTTMHDKMLGELSDGERQRTLIARALAQETPVILLDEPTAFLDIPNRYEVLQTMRKISEKEKKLFLFSTHDLEFLLETADKIWLLYPDKAYEGSPEDLLREKLLDPLFRSTGIGYEIGRGLHIPHHTDKGTVILTGEPAQVPWIAKALVRAGYAVAKEQEEQPASCHITAKKREILLEEKKSGSKIGFKTIYSLILYMRKHL